MAYQVIARKWRSKDFSELVGQEHVSQTLLNALRQNRLHHALLFTGPRGTGKTSSARILAKTLRCPNAVDFVPCHVCSECEEIASGRSVNVIEIDGASNNGVDAIRELRDTVGYMPSSGKTKLYIIDEVHMLSTSAFNALLKTLEEPPGHVIFVLATTEAHKIPETVLSRVQRFDFRCIPTRAIVGHLQTICKAEGVNAEADALWTIARQGAGSMRDSQSFLDQAITFAGNELTLAKVTEVLGLTDRRLLSATLEALVNQDASAVVGCLEKVFTAGYEARLFVQDILEMVRHLLMVKLLDGKPGQVVDLPDSEIQFLHGLSAKITSEDIQTVFDMMLKGANDLGRAPDARIALEMVLLRIAGAPRLAQLGEWLREHGAGGMTAPSPQIKGGAATLGALSRSGQTTTASALNQHVQESQSPLVKTVRELQGSQNQYSPATSGAPSESGPVIPSGGPKAPTGTPKEAWFDLVKKIHAVNSMVGAQLENCFLKELTGNKITLGVSPKMKFLADKLNAPDFKKKILNYVTTFWGGGYTIEVVTAEPASEEAATPKAIATQKETSAKNDLRKQIEEHPLVKATQKNFKTEIRSIKENKQ